MNKSSKRFVKLCLMALSIGFPVFPNAAFGSTSNSSIASNFNNTSIPGGDYIWFSSVLSATGFHNNPSQEISFTNSTIAFTCNNLEYKLNVPDALIDFDQPKATTSFDTTLHRWETSVDADTEQDIFLSGLAFKVPNGGFPGGIGPVTWSGNLASTFPGQVTWKWAAAVYSNLGSNNNALRIKPVDDDDNQCGDSDLAGTPENFKDHLMKGAKGKGHGDFTGSYSCTQTINTKACVPEASSMLGMLSILGVAGGWMTRRKRA